MLDESLQKKKRDLEGNDLEQEARELREQLRSGKLFMRVALMAAFLGSDAAQLVTHDLTGEEVVELQASEKESALQLVFGSLDIPERAKEFLTHLVQHDQEARATLTHYELVQEGDKALPATPSALKALTDHLRANPNHLEAIAQMNRRVFQLIPVYEPEGAGFQRMVNALDDHQRDGQINTYVRNELRTRWRMTEGTGKIVGWQMAVTEGAKVLPQESNRFLMGEDGRVQRVEDQLNQWQQYCQEQGLELCSKGSYGLLQMQEIRQSAQNTPLDQLGIDSENATYLGDKTRQPGSLVPVGGWRVDQLVLGEDSPAGQRAYARFRPSVVVNI